MQLNLRHPLAIYGIPLSVFGISILLAEGFLFQTNDALFTGITYDLTLTAPLLYFLLIKRTSIPKITLVPVFAAGLIVASLVVPEHSQFHLELVKNYLLPVVELSAMAAIVYYAIRTAKQFKKQKTTEKDTYSIIKESGASILGKGTLAQVLATELGMIYYAFFAWKKPVKGPHQFTIHKESGIIPTMGAIIFLILVETVVLHLLLMQWNVLVAWILFGISCYTGLQLFGHTKALSKRFVTLTENQLHLKYGLFGDATIKYSSIEKIESSSRELPEDTEGLHKMALIDGLESHNIILHLNEPITITKAYGMQKKGSIILLYVDDKEGFVRKLSERIN